MVAEVSLTHADLHPLMSGGELTDRGRPFTRLIALAITTVTPTPVMLAHRSCWPSLRILLFLVFVMTPQLRITTYFISAIKQAHRLKQPGARAPPKQHLLRQPVTSPWARPTSELVLQGLSYADVSELHLKVIVVRRTPHSTAAGTLDPRSSLTATGAGFALLQPSPMVMPAPPAPLPSASSAREIYLGFVNH